MDEAFIYVSVISGLFGLIGLQLLTHNWFKKERFKLEAYNMKKQNDLQLKKMAKDMGISYGKSNIPEPIQSSNPISSLLPEIVKNLEPEQISALADRFMPQGEDGGGSDSGFNIDSILEYAAKNPEVAKAFLGGLTGGKKTQGADTGSQVF